MADIETRSDTRDSFFLLAQVRVENKGDPHRVRVRNLSDGGMMGEGSVLVRRGDRVAIDLRDINGLGGTIAWVQGQRFGIAFDEDIDSNKARRAIGQSRDDTGGTAPVSHAHRPPQPREPGPLRKV